MKLITDLFDRMEARRKREDAIAFTIFGVGCLTFIVLGIIIAIVSTIMNAVESSTVRSTYGDTYATACINVPAGADSVDNLPDKVAPRAVLLLEAGTDRRHDWYSQLPAQWQAQNKGQVALIGCVQQEWVVLETCEYQRASNDYDSGSYTVSIDRKQDQVTVVLINPDTSRRIDSLTLSGSEPEACPVDDGKLTSGERRGNPVQWSDAAAWVEGYVFD